MVNPSSEDIRAVIERLSAARWIEQSRFESQAPHNANIRFTSHAVARLRVLAEISKTFGVKGWTEGEVCALFALGIAAAEASPLSDTTNPPNDPDHE